MLIESKGGKRRKKERKKRALYPFLLLVETFEQRLHFETSSIQLFGVGKYSHLNNNGVALF